MNNNNYGIYVHIPFCKARCGYCAFSSCCDYELQEAYFCKLFQEIDRASDLSAPITTIYLGGGTPSSVDVKYLDGLFVRLTSRFDLSRVAEVTAECNPESVTDELLACLERNGVNRLSFGLQSVNDDTLARIGRVHRYADFEAAVQLARKYGFDNINADLILGLPESAEDFRRSVETVANLPLAHVSVYALELHEGSPLYRLCNEQYPYTDDQLADMYDYAVATLAACGFARYETSNFAREGRRCRHNLNYWTEGRYYAFGAAASGFVGDVRYTNPFSVTDYLASPLECLRGECQTLGISEQANEFVMLGLRLDDGVSLAEFADRYGCEFFTFFPNAAALAERGFLAVERGFVKLPTEKFYIANSILCELLTDIS